MNARDDYPYADIDGAYGRMCEEIDSLRANVAHLKSTLSEVRTAGTFAWRMVHPKPSEAVAVKHVKLDSRRRVSLAKVGRPEHTKYTVTEHPNGVLELTPVRVERFEVQVGSMRLGGTLS